MKRMLPVEVLDWPERPNDTSTEVEMTCDHCGVDLIVPAARGVRVLATIGMGMLHDITPTIPHGLPSSVRCPRCLHSYDLGK